MPVKRGHGRGCRICGRWRPSEQFSGRGRRTCVCKACSRLPAEERRAIEAADEIFGYLKQSHISDLNVRRLLELSTSSSIRTAELAGIVLEVARVKPYKRRRLKVLAREQRDLFTKLQETGLILAHQGW